MNTVIATILALGILPSLTAAFGSLGAYTGPLNPLKVGIPLLLYYAWTHRGLLTRRQAVIALGAWSIGTLSTLVAAYRCGMPSGPIREWGSITIGLLAAFCFWGLPRGSRGKVLAFWATAVFGSALLERLSPGAIDWLYANVFDPNTRNLDFVVSESRLLGGIFGIQSLAKLLAWLPWLLWLHSLESDQKRATWVALAILSTVSLAAILATSQRGPFIAAGAGWIGFALHRAIKLRDRKVLGLTALGGVAALALTFMIVPTDVMRSRVWNILGQRDSSTYGQMADGNVAFRKLMFGLSLEVIAHHPIGNACVSPDVFARHGLSQPVHSHHLILQQFRERGWAWGLVHLFAWLSAGLALWHSRAAPSSAAIGAWVTVMIGGLFDHPWFVLNQAMILGVILLYGLLTPSRRVGYNPGQ